MGSIEDIINIHHIKPYITEYFSWRGHSSFNKINKVNNMDGKEFSWQGHFSLNKINKGSCSLLKSFYLL